jgi:hypothetical protein
VIDGVTEVPMDARTRFETMDESDDLDMLKLTSSALRGAPIVLQLRVRVSHNYYLSLFGPLSELPRRYSGLSELLKNCRSDPDTAVIIRPSTKSY